MKSAGPRESRFSWGSPRSGGQTRSEAISLTPPDFIYCKCETHRGPILFAATASFPIFFRFSFVADFAFHGKTFEGRKSFGTDCTSSKIVFPLDM